MNTCSTPPASEYHVSTSGDDTNDGSNARPFKTITQAACVAQPGDVITVHEGIYRERVNPPRGGASDEKRIIYRAAPGEQVVIKGSEHVNGWTRVEGDVWMVRLPNGFFGDYNPYQDLLHGDWYEAKRPFHTGAVYRNGHWLREAAKKGDVLQSLAVGVAQDERPELMNLRELKPGAKDAVPKPAVEFASAAQGINVIELPAGKTCVGRMRDGDTLVYEIDFGENSHYLVMDAASPLEGGLVEVRRGDATGELLGQFDMGFTAEWTSFQPCFTSLTTPQSGKQAIALVFKTRPKDKQTEDTDIARWFAEVDDQTTTIWAEFKDFDPEHDLVEINVRRTVFYPDAPGRDYITVRGFTLEHAAPPWCPPTAEQPALIGTHWSKGWIIEDNTIRYSVCVGVSLGKYGNQYDNTHDFYGEVPRAVVNGWNRDTIGHHIVRNNHIYHCGQAGIVGSLGCAFSTIEYNEIHDIRKDHAYGGCETAGIKLHGFVDGVLAHNHIYRCEHWGGLWLDWMGQGARVTGNLLHDNSQDMMFEMNHGPFLVDHNILLSRAQVTKVSSSGAYVHNLWTDSISLWPTEQRQTYYFLPHSTNIVARSATNQQDDRYFNNLFVGGNATSVMDEHDFALTASGNVFVAGAKFSRHETRAVVAENFDPAIRLTQEQDGWWLEMNVNPDWVSGAARDMVTTERLGIAVVTGAPYEHHDGSPYRIDTDYYGAKRADTNLTPGPFCLLENREFRMKVWPMEKRMCEHSNPTT